MCELMQHAHWRRVAFGCGCVCVCASGSCEDFETRIQLRRALSNCNLCVSNMPYQCTYTRVYVCQISDSPHTTDSLILICQNTFDTNPQ